MKFIFGPLLAVVLGAALPAFADLRELSQSDLRNAVDNHSAISSQRMLQKVEAESGGVVIDMRAFTLDGKITYRLLTWHDSGMLEAVMIDASSGRFIEATTYTGIRVSAFAEGSQ